MTVGDYVSQFAIEIVTPQHELIEECRKHFGIFCVQGVTLEQAAEWMENIYRRNYG